MFCCSTQVITLNSDCTWLAANSQFNSALFEANSITIDKANAWVQGQEPVSSGQVSGYITLHITLRSRICSINPTN